MAVHLHGSRTVTCHRVRGEEERVSVSSGTYYDCMSEEALDAAGNEVTGDDTACTLLAVLISDEHDIEHLVTGVHLHFAFADLAAEGGISTEEQLLTGLTLCVEGTAYLRATERTVVEQTSVLTGERNALCYTLVDDVIGNLRQTIDIRLTSAVVTTFDRIVVETINTIAVVLVVLRRVDTALCSNRVRTTRRILDTEVEDVKSHLCKGGSSRSTSQTGTDDDDVETTFVSGINEFLMVLIVGPLQL